MRRDGNGDYIVSPEQMFTLRQGLFVTVHHLDPVFDGDLQAITGRNREEFDGLMRQIDDLGR